MIEITEVFPGSIGAELDLKPGDRILSINGLPIRDLLDFHLYASGKEDLLLEVQKKSGELWDVEVEKDAGADLGVEFEHPQPTQCGNNCLFCFVHQLPRGMRSSLYVKDEDYRFSFLYGSYVTLTNTGEEEICRILDQKLSPLYVSVHATDDQLRSRLLGRQSPSILEILRRLTQGGIEIHTQVVLCPGINDKEELDRTVSDLFSLYPGVRTLAVVPVGLTGYRQRLPQLRTPTPQEAVEVLGQVHRWQRDFLNRSGSRFVYAADEFYLQAQIDFPVLEEYEDLAQLENGVGMITLFRSQAEEVLAEAFPLAAPPVSTITGVSANRVVEEFARELSIRTGVPIRVHTVRNRFFGGHVTVTGLLTGRDVIEELRGKDLGEVLLLPEVVLREGEDVFLDDTTIEDLERELKTTVRKIPSDPAGLLEALEDLAM